MFRIFFLSCLLALHCVGDEIEERSFDSVRALKVNELPRIDVRSRQLDVDVHAIKYRLPAEIGATPGLVTELWMDRAWIADAEGVQGKFELRSLPASRHEIVVVARKPSSSEEGGGEGVAFGRIVLNHLSAEAWDEYLEQRSTAEDGGGSSSRSRSSVVEEEGEMALNSNPSSPHGNFHFDSTTTTTTTNNDSSEEVEGENSNKQEPRSPSSSSHASSPSVVTRMLGMPYSPSVAHITIRTYPNMTRSDIPALLQRLGFSGRGAEVGVWQGDNAYQILRRWPGCSRFYLVDLYLNDEMGVEPGDPRWVTQEQMDNIMEDAKKILAPFEDKIEFVRENSMMAALALPQDSLDYVFLDTSVGRDNVLHDLLAWYPVVRPGGVIAGHDYYNAAGATGGALEFLALKVGGRVELHVTGEKVASFFFFKPKCPTVQYPLSEVHGKMSDSEKKLVQLLDAERSFDERVQICSDLQ